MKLTSIEIKIWRFSFDPISVITGFFLVIGFLLYGIMKVAYDCRGVTLIFGRGGIDPQPISIVTFSLATISILSLVATTLLRSFHKDGKRLETIISRIITPFLFVLGILTLVSPSLMKPPNNLTTSLGIGAIISGILFIISGICLFIRFYYDMVSHLIKKINTQSMTQSKRKNIIQLAYEVEKLGAIIVDGLKISHTDKPIIELINLYWNYNQLTSQIGISETDRLRLVRENERMNRYVKSLGLEVNDYTSRKYNNMNLEILSTEQSNDVNELIIIRTITPEIRHNNIIIQRSKVVLAGPIGKQEEKNE
jgi:membrane protein CcdC involved in cytochrome C biogenesis